MALTFKSNPQAAIAWATRQGAPAEAAHLMQMDEWTPAQEARFNQLFSASQAPAQSAPAATQGALPAAAGPGQPGGSPMQGAAATPMQGTLANWLQLFPHATEAAMRGDDTGELAAAFRQFQQNPQAYVQSVSDGGFMDTGQRHLGKFSPKSGEALYKGQDGQMYVKVYDANQAESAYTPNKLHQGVQTTANGNRYALAEPYYTEMEKVEYGGSSKGSFLDKVFMAMPLVLGALATGGGALSGIGDAAAAGAAGAAEGIGGGLLQGGFGSEALIGGAAGDTLGGAGLFQTGAGLTQAGTPLLTGGAATGLGGAELIGGSALTDSILGGVAAGGSIAPYLGAAAGPLTLTGGQSVLEQIMQAANNVPPGTTTAAQQVMGGGEDGGAMDMTGSVNSPNGAGGGGTVFQQGIGAGWTDDIINGIKSLGLDPTKLTLGVAKGLLDYFGTQAAGEANQDMFNTMWGAGAPSRARFDASFNPGWSVLNADPSLQTGVDAASDSVLRKLSMQGNPAGNPGAMMEAQKHVLGNFILPATDSYRRTNLAGGQLGFSEAANFGGNNAAYAMAPYNAAGTAIGNALGDPMDDLMKKLGGGMLNNFRLNMGGPV